LFGQTKDRDEMWGKFAMERHKRILSYAAVLVTSLFVLGLHSTADGSDKKPFFKIVIHGGAGTITRQNMTAEMEQQYRAALTEALQTGHKILNGGGSSLDAVEAAIRIMEDSPLFNAGKGAVFTSSGTNELDASVMDGSTLKAGAVAGLKHVKNPISLARLVMEKSPHVMMAGEGAEAFARQQGAKMVSQKYFFTERLWKQLQDAKKKERQQPPVERGPVHGTVGAVALDAKGALAAGTSTGGMTNKRFGRIGDSPIIGAGTYADNRACAVSATGDGEYFIRLGVARDIVALMQYMGKSVSEAADMVILEKLTKLGGTGGVIAIDGDGKHAWPFNTYGMCRGYMDSDGKVVVEIYKD
jgi:L-asparaginase / beta-aspartyl-peptidase